MEYRLSPSDLTFLWDECPRCFYLKVARGLSRPFAMPRIFTRIDKLMKDFFVGRSTKELWSGLPEGVVVFGEKWVRSGPITFPWHASQCVIRGKFDALIQFADSSYAVVDFKTTEPRPEHVAFYGRQLHAYAYALENPAPGALGLGPIGRMGLLCVEPVAMDRSHAGRVAYLGEVTWLECPRDDGAFLNFLDRVLALLERPEPPRAKPSCGWCQYRETARSSGL